MDEPDEKRLETREQFAKLAHEQWSGWMKYLFGKCSKISKGRMVIPKWAVERWSYQMITPYIFLMIYQTINRRRRYILIKKILFF